MSSRRTRTRITLLSRNILIVKKAALGDVVRTSYFAGALRRKYGQALRLCWLTSTRALPLLRHNPHIDKLTDDAHELQNETFDHIFSLDDEREILEEVSSLEATTLTGAYLSPAGAPIYTPDSSEWFDMGLLSRFGKNRADQLKRENCRSHAEIFSNVFQVDEVTPEFFGEDRNPSTHQSTTRGLGMRIGLNAHAGERWKSKRLEQRELNLLIRGLLQTSFCADIVLLGAGEDYKRNVSAAVLCGDPRISVARTDEDVLVLARAIRETDILITSDSLALHLAVAQRVPFVAFFAPTSAAEIDSFGLGEKVISTSADYCSYRCDADNSSVTAERILEGVARLRSLLPAVRQATTLAQEV